MRIAEIAIRRPVFLTCVVLSMLAVGLLSLFSLPVDQYPNVEFPWMSVVVTYPGAGPEEVANLLSKPIEEEVRTIAGLKQVQSYNYEGVTFLYLEFTLETDLGYAEQQVRDRVALARMRLPKEVKEPLIYRYDLTDQPVATIGLRGDLSPGRLYEIADREARPRLEQVNKVSRVRIYGGAEREIQVLLERRKLADYELSVSQVGKALEMGGNNIPLGKHSETGRTDRETIFRSLGEYTTLDDLRNVIVKFAGNDVPVRLGDLGRIVDGQREETSLAFLNGRPMLLMEVHRQSGANVAAVAEAVKRRIAQLNREWATSHPGCTLELVRDGAKPVRISLIDMGESIGIGIVLTVGVVFLFLGTLRSTLITGVALPNSLIGGFMIMAVAGFSLNILTLVALSLAVGLLIDDAIVVRENIFRHLSLGKTPEQAALEGTQEVGLAVIATTLAILSVFGPIAFVGGITGRYLREFGLTVCFVMLISLFDALTMGPMLSAHFAGGKRTRNPLVRAWTRVTDPVVLAFERLQAWLVRKYEALSRWVVGHPRRVLLLSAATVALSVLPLGTLPKTFLPTPDLGELQVSLELPPGSTLQATREAALAVDRRIRENRNVALTSTVVGFETGDPTQARIYVHLTPYGQRRERTSEVQSSLREQLKDFERYRLKLTLFDPFYGNERPFALKLLGADPRTLDRTAERVLDLMRSQPGLIEADMNQRTGKPELRVVYDERRTEQLGISTTLAGAELRAQIEGLTPARFRAQGEEWDIRVRLRDEDRDLNADFGRVLVPNVNYRLVSLSEVARLSPAAGPTLVFRQDGQRALSLSADLTKGTGIGNMMDWMNRQVKEQRQLPEGVSLVFEGQSEQYIEMAQNMTLAISLAVLFLYLVLSSLYESFLTPFILLLPLPLAAAGALVALWLGGESLSMYAVIALVMLLGVASKNSILLVDYTNQLVAKGMLLKDALVQAGKTRLRPILMTSMALVAGTLPVAIGLNEASKQRTGMGYVIIGGVISSTLLTLVVVPAVMVLFKGRRRSGADTPAARPGRGQRSRAGARTEA